MFDCRHKAVAPSHDDSSIMECVESVSSLSLPDDCLSGDAAGSAASKTSTRRISPRYGCDITHTCVALTVIFRVKPG